MKLNNSVYDVLKWLCLVAIPLLAVAYQGLAKVWGWPFAAEISTTANIICTLIGGLIGVSTYNYIKEDNK